MSLDITDNAVKNLAQLIFRTLLFTSIVLQSYGMWIKVTTISKNIYFYQLYGMTHENSEWGNQTVMFVSPIEEICVLLVHKVANPLYV